MFSKVTCDVLRGISDYAILICRGSNWEGAIVDRIQEARTDGTDGIVYNPAGHTHTSVAIRDALLGTAIPFVELHVANIHAREEWRHHSYFSDKAKAIIVYLSLKLWIANPPCLHALIRIDVTSLDADY